MRHAVRPAVEVLESHLLLTGTAAVAPVALTLATDQTSYAVGQPVHMTLTETNVSNHDVQVASGPATDGFFVTQGGVTIWRSNAPTPLIPSRLVTLHPGMSFTVSATWDGHPNDALGRESSAYPTGTFLVHSQANAYGAAATPVAITISPAGVATSPPSPVYGPPPTAPPIGPTSVASQALTNSSLPQPYPSPGGLTVRVTTDQFSYRVGSPVRITLTETNTTNHDVQVLSGGQVLRASVTGPRGPVWTYRDLRMIPTRIGVLHPGESRQLTVVWNGRPNVPGAAVVPGTYTVFAGVDGVFARASFGIHA